MLDEGPVDIFVQICLPLYVFYDMGHFFEFNLKAIWLLAFRYALGSSPLTNSTSLMAPACYKVSRDTSLVCVNEYQLPVADSYQ